MPRKQDAGVREAPGVGSGAGNQEALDIRNLTPDELAVKRMLDEQPKMRIRLHQVSEDSTDRPLPDEHVHINGYSYHLKRGVELEVPESVYEVLVQAGRY